MKLTLRQYQQALIDSARVSLRSNKNVLIQAPTGAGKTVLATFMADALDKKDKRLYFICHRHELIIQTAKTFSKNGLAYSYIANGHHYNPLCNIQICSIDTLKNRYKKLPIPAMCIWDEAHHLGAAGWSKVHSYYNESYHVGLSATPQRLDGKGLGQWFDDMIIETSVAKLIEQKDLSDYRLFAPAKLNLKDVKIVMGDYNQTELAVLMDKAHITGDIIKHWKLHALGMKTIVFAININHSMNIVRMFNESGIKAAHIDGSTPRKERQEVCLKFAQGEYDVISNVGLMGEGFDLSAQTDIDVTIECVISARPTQSLALWLQMCGRALRKKNNKAIILDHAGNATRHGLPCEDRDWSLNGDAKQGKKKKDEDIQKIKECPKCYCVHAPAPRCPECGHVYAVTPADDVLHVDGELQEVDKESMRLKAKYEQANAGSIEALIELGKKRGYKNPTFWAAKVYTSRLAKQRN